MKACGNYPPGLLRTVTATDGAGRVVLTGECGSVPDGIADVAVKASRDGSGYSVNIDIDDATVLTADYYDSYQFTGLPRFKGRRSIFHTKEQEAAGLRTGGMTRILGGGSVLLQLVEYDSKRRLAREIATNHLSGYDETLTTYTFNVSPATVKHTHSSRYLPQPVTHSIVYTYDGMGRPATVGLTLPDGSTKQLAAYGYDDRGRTGSERLGGTVETAYGYTLQGWRQTSSNAVHSQRQRLAYGPDGYVTQKSDTYRRASVAESYSYDDAGRLVAFESEYKGPPPACCPISAVPSTGPSGGLFSVKMSNCVLMAATSTTPTGTSRITAAYTPISRRAHRATSSRTGRSKTCSWFTTATG